MVHISTMEYYSAFKKNEILRHATKWVNLEYIMLKWNKPGTKGQILYDLFHLHET